MLKEEEKLIENKLLNNYATDPIDIKPKHIEYIYGISSEEMNDTKLNDIHGKEDELLSMIPKIILKKIKIDKKGIESLKEGKNNLFLPTISNWFI